MLLTWGLVAGGLAQAGLLEDDEARKAILELRQKVETQRQTFETQLTELQRRSADDGGVARKGLVDFQNQLEAQRAELAGLRGQLEQLQRELRETQRKLAEQSKGHEERFRALEPSRVSVDGQEFVTEPSERKDYEAAMALFKKGDFANVQGLWVDFIRRYPQSGYRLAALFWLGNAQYATRDYKEAITNFRSLVSVDAQHPKAAESLLSIANCQIELKEVRGARKTLEELIKQHPQSDAAAAARERLAKLK